jgi:hypothetical protein
MLKELTAILSDYFEVGCDCYHYILERVKYAELTAKDFREYNEDDVAEIAEHLIANGVTVQRWIPVTERLPKQWHETEEEHFGEPIEFIVLICGAKCATTLGFDGNNFFDLDSGEIYEVSHWMPLPEPPKAVPSG